MKVLELMKQRCSVRDFVGKPVEKEKLLAILESARVAPSACNRQPWHIIVLQNEEMKIKVSPHWGGKTPVIMVVCGDHRFSWRRKDGKDHCDIDAAIAIDHMTLMAAELGLGTCWVCWFDAFAASEALGLPEHLEPVALLLLGYPKKVSDPERHGTQRKKIEEIVSWDGYESRKEPSALKSD